MTLIDILEDKVRTVLSFGGGLQTTALSILVAQGKVSCDSVVFADTGAEKPETYWYMESYTEPLFRSLGIPFAKIHNEQPCYLPDLYGYMWRVNDIPDVRQRRCSDHYKRRVITHFTGKDVQELIGFSAEEIARSQKPIHKGKRFPLIEMGLDGSACRGIITSYGWPVPVKSSCFICPFQRPYEWNWLKNNHLDLFQKALELERHFHEHKPYLRDSVGLFGGRPLRHFAEGKQNELFLLGENSCWEGHCGH